MTTASACASCPFRVGTSMRYDADAMECLHDGNEPACHSKVGRDRIFVHSPMSAPEGSRCAGYDLWIAGDPGHQQPIPFAE